MIRPTLHQLKVFETVARNGNFTRAAAELLITQPTVSSQMKQLSNVVGLPLFEQIGKSLYLTEAGRELLLTCRDILEKLNDFKSDINPWIILAKRSKYPRDKILGCSNYS